jgi:hypothetical protein
VTTSWRDDPDLVRGEDEDLAPDPELDVRWRGVFEELIPAVVGSRAGRGLLGQAIRLMVYQARKYVSRNPDRARDTVIQAIRLTAAQLRIEPAEVYGPDA